MKVIDRPFDRYFSFVCSLHLIADPHCNQSHHIDHPAIRIIGQRAWFIIRDSLFWKRVGDQPIGSSPIKLVPATIEKSIGDACSILKRIFGIQYKKARNPDTNESINNGFHPPETDILATQESYDLMGSRLDSNCK